MLEPVAGHPGRPPRHYGSPASPRFFPVSYLETVSASSASRSIERASPTRRYKRSVAGSGLQANLSFIRACGPKALVGKSPEGAAKRWKSAGRRGALRSRPAGAQIGGYRTP